MTEDWRTRLVARHAGLFCREVGGRDLATGYPSVGEGWRGIVESASARIAAVVAPCRTGKMTIIQIKQKFGGLRIYTENHGLPKEVLVMVCDVIDLAEARADCTCETCGAAGMLHEHAGWLTTRCEEHQVGQVRPPKAGWENLVVKYSADGGGMRIVSCRRYDRERDAFEDVPVPPDFETEEEDRQ